MFNGYRKDDDEYNARYKLAYTLYTLQATLEMDKSMTLSLLYNDTAVNK